MEEKISKENLTGNSLHSVSWTNDHNLPCQEQISVKNEEIKMSPVLDASQLELEMEKRKIREEIIASEIVRRRELEAQVRMELMVEKQMMGMRHFYGVPCVDHSVLMQSWFSGSLFRPNYDQKLLNLGPSDDVNYGERMDFMTKYTSGVGEGEFMQTDQHPHENNVFTRGQEHEMQDVVLRQRQPFERDLAQVAGESIAESRMEQADPRLGITGVKRKAESLAEETASVPSKWYCSLCGVSATSEVALNIHLQGKKHKAKEKNTSKTSDISPSGTEEKCRWYCSICQLSLTSESTLRTHLQGKKHKAKEEALGLASNLDVKPEAVSKWYCSLCQVSAVSENNLNDHLRGKKHKSKEGTVCQETGNLDCNVTEKVSGLVEVPQTNEEMTRGNKEEEEAEHSEGSGCVSKDVMKNEGGRVKCWHCKMCNEKTWDEDAMAIHRKSDKHMTLLKKIGGGVIVVERMMVNEPPNGGEVAKEQLLGNGN